MRKLDTASNAEGSVRRESCNQEEVTAFYRIDSGEEQINAPFNGSNVQQFNLGFRLSGLNCFAERYMDNATVKGATR